jgi:hypothetical protein
MHSVGVAIAAVDGEAAHRVLVDAITVERRRWRRISQIESDVEATGLAETARAPWRHRLRCAKRSIG